MKTEKLHVYAENAQRKYAALVSLWPITLLLVNNNDTIVENVD